MAEYTRTVLELAKAGEYYEGELPTEGTALSTSDIEAGDYFVTEAIEAWATGMRDEYVGKILVAAGEMTQDQFEADMAEGEIISDDVVDVDVEPIEENAEQTLPRAEPDSAIQASSEEEDFMAANKLPIPQTIETEENGLPADLTTLDDRVLRRYHSLYNGFLGRSRWLLGLATGELIRAEHLRDEAMRVALLKVNRIDPKTEKPKSVATLDAEAKESADYQMWADAANKHEREVAMRKAVVDIYQGNVAVLSREWTMRTEEFERSK